MKTHKNEDMEKCPICERVYNVAISNSLYKLKRDGLKFSNIKGDICLATEEYHHNKIYLFLHYVPDNPTESGS